LAIDDDWLKEIIDLARANEEAALAKTAESQLVPEEKQGISMALKGICRLGERPEQATPSIEQLARMKDGVLLESLDSAYIETWLLYARGLHMVKDEGGVQGEYSEPKKEVGAQSVGVQLSLNAYGVPDDETGQNDAQKVEDQ
jgi:hypothetical protein